MTEVYTENGGIASPYACPATNIIEPSYNAAGSTDVTSDYDIISAGCLDYLVVERFNKKFLESYGKSTGLPS